MAETMADLRPLSPGEIRSWHTSTTGELRVLSHAHPYYEVILKRTGDVEFENGSHVSHTLSPCVVVHMPMTLHGALAHAGAPYERDVLYFEENVGKRFGTQLVPLARLPRANLCVFLPDAPTFSLLCTYADAMTDTQDEAERLSYLSVLLFTLLKLPPEQIQLFGRQDQGYIGEILQYLRGHFQEQVGTEELARRYFVSRAKLNRDFEQVAKTTVKQYVLQLRLNYAKHLLRLGMRAKDVGKTCGFCSAQYFSRMFYRQTGQTPGAYGAAAGASGALPDE